jgi:uroporphyrinogen decarboxylase
MTLDLSKHKPDFEQFLKVLRRKGRPGHLPFYEHVASEGFVSARLGRPLAGSWKNYVEFWMSMGYDCVPMEIHFSVDIKGDSLHGGVSRGSEEFAVIKTMADFEKFPWPSESAPINFFPFERVAELLPDGAKIVGGVGGGPYEWTSKLLGVMGLSYALVDCPELVERVFAKFSVLYENAVKTLADMPAVGALRQGDDLGFKTSTFLAPDDLRKFVFPIYRKMTAAAHAKGKPFILHSCGNLAEVYEDIIACGVDAKHSFEETILPVGQFKKQYGSRITPIGGLDVDFICRRSKDEIRAYARRAVEECFAADGHWALGTGNSLTNYMPVENYIAALEAGREAAG